MTPIFTHGWFNETATPTTIFTHGWFGAVTARQNAKGGDGADDYSHYDYDHRFNMQPVKLSSKNNEIMILTALLLLDG